MSFIDEEKINLIKSSSDIVDVVSEYISLTKKGKNYFGVCPFHNDHGPSLSVSPERQVYKCFSCGNAGNVITFVMNFENVGFNEALSILAKKSGIDYSYNKKQENTSFRTYYDIYDTVASIYKNNLESNAGSSAKDYLKNRGIDDNAIKDFDIGLSINNILLKALNKYDEYSLYKLDLLKKNNDQYYDTFTNRIMFPLHDNEGNIVGFSGRVYNTESSSKYINTGETEIFRKGNILYNYYKAKAFARKEKCIIICEGFMDVIRLSLSGYKNSIALMGTSCTLEQLNAIRSLNVEVILNLDQDNAGIEATMVLGNMLLKENINPKVIVFNDSKDTDELIFKFGKEVFDKAFNNKVDFIDFKFNNLKNKYNLKNDNEVTSYINILINEIDKLNDPILQELKIKDISRTYNISEQALYTKIKRKEKIIIKEEVVKKKKSYDKYDISELKILNFMLMNEDAVRIFENKLGYLINEDRNKFACEIVSFKNKNKGFILSDFITYIIPNEKLKNVFDDINALSETYEYTEKELYDYIDTIKKHLVDNQIKKLNEKIKSSLDINEQLKLLERIENLKKDVLKW